jgi:cyanophycinase-like exopeptidase
MSGLLALLGGGEFSFGETLDADRAWLERAPPGPVGFVPAASGSADYPRHFADYLESTSGRAVETIPIYRERDGRRARNADRIRACAAVYLGGGVADHLLDALPPGLCRAALAEKPRAGGVVVAIAAAAQACGARCRSVFAGRPLDGLGLAPRLAIETNFDPAHDRRLRRLLADSPGLQGVGLAAGSALLLAPDGSFEAVGSVFTLAEPEADLVPLAGDG